MDSRVLLYFCQGQSLVMSHLDYHSRGKGITRDGMMDLVVRSDFFISE